MEITINYKLGDSWKEYKDYPPEIIHEIMLEQIETDGYVHDTENLRITKYIELQPIVLDEPKVIYPRNMI